MLLRASGQETGNDYDVNSIVNSDVESGVPHGTTLSAFAEAVLGEDEAALETTRRQVREVLGANALVDAAAVVAMFMLVDRIADSMGIPLDGRVAENTQELRAEIGIGRFASAQNTPSSNQVS